MPAAADRVQRRAAMYAVSEYGEFSSLLALAKLLNKELGLHPVFVFKHDYGMLAAHSQELEALHFSWASGGKATHSMDFLSEGGHDDYFPRNPKREPNSALRPNASLEPTASASSIVWLLTVGGLALSPLLVLAALPWLTLRLAKRSLVPSLRSIARRIPAITLARYRHLTTEVEKIVDRFRPVIVISGQDYALSITSMVAKAAAKQGVATAILPFSMVPTTKEVAESFAGSNYNRLRGLMTRKIMMARYPKWVNRYRGRYYSRLSLSEVLASEALDLSPPSPWTPNSGRGVVLLPSQQGYDYSVRAGIPPHQAKVTGALWSDTFARSEATREHRRSELLLDIEAAIKGHNQKAGRARTQSREEPSIVIISWPPNQSPRQPTGLEDFDSLNTALIDMLVTLGATTQVKLAVSLHPTLAGTSVATRLARKNICVLDKPLVEVIDCCDLFVATVSSTLMWSLQLEIPSINFDVYRYGYREFVDAGMKEVYSVPQLRSELLLNLRYKEAYGELKRSMHEKREYWGVYDGQSKSRIVQEITALIERGAASS